MRETADSPAERQQASARILVVDDDPKLRKVVVDVLGAAGYAVAEAEDGQAALAYLRGGGPAAQLVLLDLAMPVMDGWWCHREIRNDPALAGLPVVVVSAGAPAAVTVPADGYLEKPFHTAELLAVVRAALAKGSRRPA
jgi:CheY-like chemotaxis protein